MSSRTTYHGRPAREAARHCHFLPILTLDLRPASTTIQPMSTARKLEPPNTLYDGDNLDILRRYIDDESIDLIYLDWALGLINARPMEEKKGADRGIDGRL